jgi:hypothetical protein
MDFVVQSIDLKSPNNNESLKYVYLFQIFQNDVRDQMECHIQFLFQQQQKFEVMTLETWAQ